MVGFRSLGYTRVYNTGVYKVTRDTCYGVYSVGYYRDS